MKNKLKIGDFKLYLISVLLIVLDQTLKILIRKNIKIFPITVINNVFQINYCENRGVAFSIGEGNVIFFAVLTIILITTVIIYYEKNKSKFDGLFKACYTMVIAGGIGNLIDRIFRRIRSRLHRYKPF